MLSPLLDQELRLSEAVEDLPVQLDQEHDVCSNVGMSEPLVI